MPYHTRYDAINLAGGKWMNFIGFYCFVAGMGGSWNIGCMWFYFGFMSLGGMILIIDTLSELRNQTDLTWPATTWSRNATERGKFKDERKWRNSIKWNMALGVLELNGIVCLSAIANFGEERIVPLSIGCLLTFAEVALTAWCYRKAVHAWSLPEMEPDELEMEMDRTNRERATASAIPDVPEPLPFRLS